MAQQLSGKRVAELLNEELSAQVDELKKQGIEPCLSIVRVGHKPEDISYENGATKRCEKVDIFVRKSLLPEDIEQEGFVEALKALNADPAIHGILILRPLPPQLQEKECKNILSPAKDVDCFGTANLAKLLEGDLSGHAPCTPEAVLEILDRNNLPVEGKHVVVVGRSLVVGKPLAMLLLNRNATVTICHSKTDNLPEICKGADILVSAVGRANMLNRDHIRPGAVVIDVGTNVLADGTLCGDVDFESASQVAGYITPVPGGVGAVTTSLLARHVIKSAKEESRF